MADYKATTSEFTAVADAIRAKGGTSASLAWPDGFASAISAIPSGVAPSGSISISQNGTYDVSAFANAIVSVPQMIEGGADSVVDDTAIDVFLSTASKIVPYAFVERSTLKTINALSCKEIGSNAFAYCGSLEEAVFPLCETIGSLAFTNCLSLSSISFPVCKTIEISAFSSCFSLNIASFPSCEVIRASAFRYCKSLMSVILLASSVVALSASNAFSSTPIVNSSYTGSFGSIFVPASLVEAYKSANNWSYYSNRITSYVEG